MTDLEPTAAPPPAPATPNAAAVAHALMLGTDPSDPATRVAYLEANLETLGRILDGHIAEMKRTRAMIDTILGKVTDKPLRRRKETI